MINEFLSNIKTLRKSRGWTQQELALKVGVKARQVQRWEAGIGQPEKKHLDKLIDELKPVIERRESMETNSSDYRELIRAINNLTDSNKLAMENNSKLVITNNLLVERVLSLSESAQGFSGLQGLQSGLRGPVEELPLGKAGKHSDTKTGKKRDTGTGSQ